MLSKINLKDKRAQVATTTTWIVATVIIVVILVVFFYLAQLFAVKSLFIDLKEQVLGLGFSEDDNLLITKTSTAYLLTSEDKKTLVNKWIDEQDIDLEDYIK